ncbi:hypothetical protein VMT65_32400 [Nocardia sp. CDC153]|uniref:TetR/AcrR family transcriptional regulator n=1 Tax=Nocardia sp. CDC153 TaxID=3112167 RepID=UPI002DB5E45A|nr:hypothetical protein [Nocardia sp. CDC153]MEC3957775.1 hypothetical protein [Nocardia sp. CDC153]
MTARRVRWGDEMTVPARVLSRRERRRLETCDEIVEVARDVLREGDDLSLRAVATQMGMTAPALYRYIDSIDELHVLVARAICTDVIAAMAEAGERYSRDDPAARLAASATALRCWALANRTEFLVAFANPTLAAVSCPIRRKALGRLPAGDDDSPNPFAAYFAQMFIDLHSRGLIVVPTADDLNPRLYALIQKSAAQRDNPFYAALGVEGLGTYWLFKLAWVRLYGILVAEVYGQVDEELVGSDVAFNTLMRETFSSLGLADRWDRLVEVSRATALRADT